jgi:hypothetical protein
MLVVTTDLTRFPSPSLRLRSGQAPVNAALLKMGVEPGVNVGVGGNVLVGVGLGRGVCVAVGLGVAVGVAVAVPVQDCGVAPPTATKSFGALEPSFEE